VGLHDGHRDKFTFTVLFLNSCTPQTGKKPDHCTKKKYFYTLEQLKNAVTGNEGGKKNSTIHKAGGQVVTVIFSDVDI